MESCPVIESVGCINICIIRPCYFLRSDWLARGPEVVYPDQRRVDFPIRTGNFDFDFVVVFLLEFVSGFNQEN